MARIVKSLILLALPVLVIVSCSKEIPPPDMSVDPFPMGTYVFSMYGLFFEDGGRYTYYELHNPDKNWPGSYTIIGDQIIITNDIECPDGEEDTYQWEFDGKSLRFKTLIEKCWGRSDYFVNINWKLEQ